MVFEWDNADLALGGKFTWKQALGVVAFVLFVFVPLVALVVWWLLGWGVATTP